ncbi:class I SAM-dependent methyltransferase [Roseivirga sp. E12]|uniref:class I SAM-dependent methyltransferase n=1 Tax=Roseivirga sp. E12 TaxID=2819237 RepID=UPI001ABCB5AC|nr:class I SAM-dependent methyltransferase [Roseivirga sp. E12]MBO3698364.1 class I SAM-dependent methyltransferase [Roseivirga sp. E12]
MKGFIKKIAPDGLLRIYGYYKKRRLEKYLKGKSAKKVFSEIYNTNKWKGETSRSGTGSDPSQTHIVIDELNRVIDEFEIKSVLDLPCGDFEWMRNVSLENVNYLGADIVDALIDRNTQQFARENVSFQVIDLIKDELPKSDLIVTRDCLVHLCFEDVVASINNIKASGSKYLLTTTFPAHSKNTDIVTGQWRTLNLQLSPFNFPKPIKVMNENCTEAGGIFKDKSLALYLIDHIQIPKLK